MSLERQVPELEVCVDCADLVVNTSVILAQSPIINSKPTNYVEICKNMSPIINSNPTNYGEDLPDHESYYQFKPYQLCRNLPDHVYLCSNLAK